MRFLDFFSGIGGFRLGMEAVGHECVGYVEWDKFARKSYEAIHNTEGEWTAHDITTVSDEEFSKFRGKVDIICGGFPCQAFSVAGKRQGFKDTRGTLFFEVARAAQQIQPRYLFLENVKGLLSHDKGKTFGIILDTLDELGYDVEWQVLNTKDFSTKERPTPQNRERIFIVAHLRGTSTRKVFPIGRESEGSDSKSKIIIFGSTQKNHQASQSQRELVYDSKGIIGSLLASDAKNPKQIVIRTVGKLPGKQEQNNRVYHVKGFSPINTKPPVQKICLPILTPDRVEKRQNGRRIKGPDEPMFTITAQDRHGVAIKEATTKGYDIANPGDSVNFSVPNSKTRRGRVGKGIANTLDTTCQQGVLTEEFRIRRLTPKECWRLQGFPDEAFEKAAAVNSDSQLYKQAGNSVTINVIQAIAKKFC
ncbi:DNA (cytosine-5-)-methyltransferase [Lysinibacillus mangiferihumi]|uniref:Cytosine-specific methyltransferase n=1 Tax=Lysinibacillus mangiferihumi TaxID=1130819 RepID=A0A4U2YVQ5_9BACI|nr:DNA (cytosine-5-)-methyltransferase [Lysinibacillus mangiferihumi]TKI65290.1 DNA (cytosine-5-)-methyltransferase [Lysinibacillus mangiferihumi]